MHFKLIIAFVEDNKTDEIMEAAREAGATGCTVINNARGEGLKEKASLMKNRAPASPYLSMLKMPSA